MNNMDAVPISVIESWLYEIERNNSRNYLSDACVEIISRLGGLQRYYEEKFCTEQMPRVDAVPVIRCKDCKWRGTYDCPMLIPNAPTEVALLERFDNDFYSYGEKDMED